MNKYLHRNNDSELMIFAPKIIGYWYETLPKEKALARWNLSFGVSLFFAAAYFALLIYVAFFLQSNSFIKETFWSVWAPAAVLLIEIPLYCYVGKEEALQRIDGRLSKKEYEARFQWERLKIPIIVAIVVSLVFSFIFSLSEISTAVLAVTACLFYKFLELNNIME